MRNRTSFLLSTPLAAAALLAGTCGSFAQQPQQQQAQGSQWARMPHMQLERQFAGPLQDTIIQRWRDPADGTICYIYLPITAAHSTPTANGFVEYGPNVIGSISCVPGAPEQKRLPGH